MKSITLVTITTKKHLATVGNLPELAEIHQKAVLHDSRQDPFFREGRQLIAVDDEGASFIIFVEGFNDARVSEVGRIGIGRLVNICAIANAKPVFVGSYHDGTYFDENIVAKLRAAIASGGKDDDQADR